MSGGAGNDKLIDTLDGGDGNDKCSRGDNVVNSEA